MAYIGHIGWDDDVLVEPETNFSGSSGGRTGGRSLTRASGTFNDLYRLPAVNTGVVVLGAAIRPTSFSSTLAILRVLDSAGTVHMTVRTTTAGGLECILGTAGAVLWSTPAAVLAVNVWAYVEFKFKVADAGGVSECRVNEAVQGTFSGDTRNAGTAEISKFTHAASSTQDMAWDDLYVLDDTGAAPYNDYLGDVVVRPLVPTGAGDLTEWTPSAGANWQCVDEQNSSMSDYVGAGAAALTDLYAMGDLVAGDVPYAWRTLTYANKSDGGTPPTAKPVTRGVLGGDVEEAALVLSTTAQPFAGAFRTVDPDGNPLTLARVNGMQSGVRSS